MSWQAAKQDAQRRFDALAALLRREGRDWLQLEIPLPLYEDADVLDLMQPENTWPLAYHRQVTRALQRMLLKAGATVRLVPVSMAAYQAWLGARENTPERRAEYAATL